MRSPTKTPGAWGYSSHLGTLLHSISFLLFNHLRGTILQPLCFHIHAWNGGRVYPLWFPLPCPLSITTHSPYLATSMLINSAKRIIQEPPMSEATQSALTTPTRTESDSMGKIDVPADRYYGAQTARSSTLPSARTSCHLS